MRRADEPRADRSGTSLAGLIAAGGTALVVVALLSMLLRGRPPEVLYARWMIHNVPLAVVPLLIGWAIQRRWPGHGLARVFLGMGAVAALHVAFMAYTDARLVRLGLGTQPDVAFVPGEVPLDVSLSFWLTSWLWLIVVGMGLVLLLVLFPDGRLPSRRWRAVVVLAVAATVLLVAGYTVWSWPWSDRLVVVTEQPSDIGIAPVLLTTGWLLLLGAVGAGIVSLGVRWRAATPDQRSQLRPVILSGSVLGVVAVALFPVQRVWVPAVLLALVVFLTSYVVAVLRFRLHELDVVVNRAVVASLLAALVTALYLGVVVGVGSLIGRRVDTPLLPLVAVGLIAVLFEPARHRVRSLVDRVLYGRDADAYEVLSELASRLRDAGSAEQVASQVASLLVRGSGASAARIHLQLPDRAEQLALAGAADEPVALTAPVLHDGEQVGEVTLHARTPADLAPDAGDLVADVTGMLGAVLRNALLTAELREQVAALRRSRQRLVEAQDSARRDLERDLHDGAQARLVALRLQVGLLDAELAGHGTLAEAVHLRQRCGQLASEVDEAIRDLRRLAHGLRPPILESDGLVAALRAATRGLPTAVELDGGGLGRFPPAVEAAVYFACLESIRNATAHAAADRVEVGLAADAGVLRFWVADDGIGFDPDRIVRGRGLESLDDRISGLGGSLVVSSRPGDGTRVEGIVPTNPPVTST
jgi:two-component system, NarL family, sensor kinase